MIEMKNFFIKCHREYVARRGGSGGGDFNTPFHKGWLFARMKTNASHFLTTNKKGDRMKTNFFDIALALRLGAA